MSRWIVKKGNTSIQEILIQDKEGIAVTTLAAAEYIKFQVKVSKTDVATVIEKTVAGGGIAVDTPSEGYLTITLTPADTQINPRLYVMGLEIKWTAVSLWEVTMIADGEETGIFEITQDVVLVP